MPKTDVQDLLGPGQVIGRSLLPGYSDDGILKPVVRGESFLEWKDGGMDIIIGFENDKVCDKWLSQPGW